MDTDGFQTISHKVRHEVAQGAVPIHDCKEGARGLVEQVGDTQTGILLGGLAPEVLATRLYIMINLLDKNDKFTHSKSMSSGFDLNRIFGQ